MVGFEKVADGPAIRNFLLYNLECDTRSPTRPADFSYVDQDLLMDGNLFVMGRLKTEGAGSPNITIRIVNKLLLDVDHGGLPSTPGANIGCNR